MRNYNLEKRKFVIAGVAVAIVFGYILRLFTLQIMSDDYKKNADSNAFLNKVQYCTGSHLRPQGASHGLQPACLRRDRNHARGRGPRHARLLPYARHHPEFFRKRMEDIKNRSVNPGYSPTPNRSSSASCLPRSSPSSRRSSSASPDSTSSGAPPGSTPTTWRRTCWATWRRSPGATSRTTTTTQRRLHRHPGRRAFL